MTIGKDVTRALIIDLNYLKGYLDGKDWSDDLVDGIITDICETLTRHVNGKDLTSFSDYTEIPFITRGTPCPTPNYDFIKEENELEKVREAIKNRVKVDAQVIED